jgi:signal peptidase I
MNRKKTNGLVETAKTVGYAVVIAIVVRTAAYEPFNIPSGSMIPTLLIGDYLFVSKFSYGYSRYSLPFSLPFIPGRIFFSAPERGDVVVFKLPLDNKTDYIKRIVGLPGESIQVRGGILHINGRPVKRERAEDLITRAGGVNYRREQRYIETLPNGRTHFILEISDDAPGDNTPKYRVPEGHYFAMGDNRDRSRDSRTEVGFIPRRNLVGRAEFLFFSIECPVWQVWNWPSCVRFGRFFQGIR